MAKIIAKKSTVVGKVPLSTDLDIGEIAVNTADNRIYTKHSDNSVRVIGTDADMLKNQYDSNDDGVVNSADYAATAEWSGILNAPATFPPSSHTHPISDIVNLQSTLDGKQAAGSYESSGTASSLIAVHEGLSDPHPQYPTLPEIATATGDIHGIVDRTQSTISFNEGTRVFSITPVSTSWDLYYKGTLYTVNSVKSITITNTSGARFIRYNPLTASLEEGGSVPDFINDIVISYIYWNSTTAKAIIVGDERHGSKRDTTWHSAQHLNVGTVWRSGGSLSYTLDNQASIQIGVGTPMNIADEDLVHTITHSASPTSDFQQILNTTASVEVLYLSDTVYTSTAQSTTPWIAGTSLARYNLVSGGSGSLVDATEGSYITYWLIATNDVRRPIKLVLGRVAHPSIDAAYSETFEEYGLSFAEQVFMYQIVLRTSSSYSNSAKVVISGVRKVLSKIASSGSTVSAGTHNQLTGRDTADSHPISSITNLQTTLDNKEPSITKSTGYAKWNGSSWVFVNETYLESYTETDPVFLASAASGITATNISNWNTAFSWGNHATAGYQSQLVSGTNIKTINGTTLLGSGDLVVGGGSGSGDVTGPASSTANHLVTFADTTGKVIKEALYFDSPSVSIPAAPAAGDLRWFARSRGGRVLPHVIGPSGVDVALQPALFGNTVYMWIAGTATTLAINFGTSFTARNSGTSAAQAHPTKSSTNAMTSLNRATFGTGTTATGSSGIQSAATVVWRGNASNLGGFFFFARFGIETLASGQQAIIGLSELNAALTGEPSVVNNTIAIGKDSADTTWQIITRNTTAVTKTNTTCTVTAGQVLDFIAFAAPNGSNVTFRLVDAVTGTVFVDNVSVSANLPASTVFMYMHAQTRSTAGTTAKLLALNRMYLETDL